MATTLPLQHAGMRAGNLALVLGQLADGSAHSRAQLAARTGLTKSSVSALVADLTTADLVVETATERSPGERGRPGTSLMLNPGGAAGIGLEVNVDYLATVVVDLTGTQRYRQVVERDNRGRSPADVLADVSTIAQTARSAAADQHLPVAGLGLALPGVFGPTRERLRDAPNLGWSDVDITALLDVEATPWGATVDNEANLAALGELWFGTTGLTDFVHVSGEVGIGAGVITAGGLFRGAHAGAGELGHVVVDPNGPACACGGRGCLERLAGQEVILARSGATTVDDLVARCQNDDDRSREALRDAGTHLGVALASATSLIDPNAIILGGTFSTLAPWLRPAVEASLDRHLPAHRERPQVATSQLGPNAAVLGAAGSVIRQVLGSPADYLNRVSPRAAEPEVSRR